MKSFSFTELTEMTVADLRSIAGDLQIPGRSKATRKADLVAFIMEFQAETCVVETEPTPAPVSTGDQGCELSDIPDDRPRTPAACPGFNTQVSLAQIYHPRPPLNLPLAYGLIRGRIAWEFPGERPALPRVLVRGPP